MYSQFTISVTGNVACDAFSRNEVLMAQNCYRVWFRFSSASSNQDFPYSCRINLLMPVLTPAGTLYRGMQNLLPGSCVQTL